MDKQEILCLGAEFNRSLFAFSPSNRGTTFTLSI